MHYAAIAPTKALVRYEYFASRKVQFCLAHEYKKGGAYTQWYDDRAARPPITNDDFSPESIVILDNGAWEKELVSFQDLGTIVDSLHPQVVILPDVLNDKRMTRYLHNAFQTYMAAACEWQPEQMTVIQGYDIWDYLEEYIRAQTPWIGFPRCMNDNGEDLRVGVARRLHSLGMWKSNVKHHALGMYGGDLGEVKDLAELGFFSIDSSNPFWRGMLRKDGDIDFSDDTYVQNYVVQQKLREVDQICSSK